MCKVGHSATYNVWFIQVRRTVRPSTVGCFSAISIKPAGPKCGQQLKWPTVRHRNILQHSIMRCMSAHWVHGVLRLQRRKVMERAI
jgi:hypothetical protein